MVVTWSFLPFAFHVYSMLNLSRMVSFNFPGFFFTCSSALGTLVAHFPVLTTVHVLSVLDTAVIKYDYYYHIHLLLEELFY